MFSKVFHKTISVFSIGCLSLFVALPTSINAQIKATEGTQRMKSLTEKTTRASNSTLKDINFRNIGPSIMSGRVDDLEVNPNNPTEFYIAYATGGLWHTTIMVKVLHPFLTKKQ